MDEFRMQKWHFYLIVGFVAATAIVFLACVWPLGPRPGITKDNFDRIKIGMKRNDVIALLGQPPRRKAGADYWENEQTRFAIAAAFDGNDVVVDIACEEVPDERGLIRWTIDRILNRPAPPRPKTCPNVLI